MRRSIPWGVFNYAVKLAADLKECEDRIRRILAEGFRPNCSRCDEPVREVYAVGKAFAIGRVPFERLRTAERYDILVRWLCADCTDEVAARLEGR